MSEIEMVETLGKLVGGGYVLRKLVGPTLDLLGATGREWADRAMNNLGRVFSSAAEKVGDLDDGSSIPPRVLKAVLDEAPFAEDEVVVEYLGGVLASGRSPVGRDDTAGVWATRIGGLSTYSLRTHFIFYSVARKVLIGKNIDRSQGNWGLDSQIFIPFGELARAMDLSDGEDFDRILHHVLPALADEGLIGITWGVGSREFLVKHHHPAVPDEGAIYGPSHRGVELFLTAQGRDTSAGGAAFLDPAIELSDFGLYIPNAARTDDLVEGETSLTPST